MAEKQLRITLTAHLTDGTTVPVASGTRRAPVYEALNDALRLGVRVPIPAPGEPDPATQVTIIYPIHRVDHFSVLEIDPARLAADADAAEGSER